MRNSYDEIFNTNPKVSTSLAFLLGLLLTSDLTAYEQSSLGNWLMLVSQTILTNAASQNLIEARVGSTIININSKEIKCLYSPAIYDINILRNIVNNLYHNQNNNNNNINNILKLLENAINDLQKQIDEIKKQN